MGAIIIFYGLLRDYNSKLFEGTKYLIENSDSMDFIKSVCQSSGCVHSATHHVLFLDGKVTLGGSGVFVGDTEYMSVCRGCYRVLTDGVEPVGDEEIEQNERA